MTSIFRKKNTPCPGGSAQFMTAWCYHHRHTDGEALLQTDARVGLVVLDPGHFLVAALTLISAHSVNRALADTVSSQVSTLYAY